MLLIVECMIIDTTKKSKGKYNENQYLIKTK